MGDSAILAMEESSGGTVAEEAGLVTCSLLLASQDDATHKRTVLSHLAKTESREDTHHPSVAPCVVPC